MWPTQLFRQNYNLLTRQASRKDVKEVVICVAKKAVGLLKLHGVFVRNRPNTEGKCVTCRGPTTAAFNMMRLTWYML